MMCRLIGTVLLLTALSGAGEAQHGAETQCNLPPSVKVGVFHEVSLAALEQIIPVMEAHKHSHGFIVTYGGRGSTLKQAQRRADLAKRQLLEKRQWINQSDGLNSRLNTLVCGYREAAAMELWVTPVGAAPPVCAPTITGPQPRRPARRPR